jgi:creatinine amidohydrolase
MTLPEVRYHMLRPQQIVARRTECPVVYIPIGTLEWHGEHNPVGADTLQADGLAILCAQQGGGLVFPPLYYGENRLEALMEANAHDREQIAQGMGLPAENFTPAHFPFSVSEQMAAYNHLLVHILAEADTLGFEVGVLVAGHYPLIDHCRAAALMFNQRQRNLRRGMVAWACLDYLCLQDRYPFAGDHAAGWETSHLLALHPETVDLSVLPAKGEYMVGVNASGKRLPPQDATAALGSETLAGSAEWIVHEVQHRLAHKDVYMGHGWSLREGLWKEEQ